MAGSGPAVIVMAEMPGISPHVARFARWVREAGFTVYMPSLFGRDGAVPERGRRRADFSARMRQRGVSCAHCQCLEPGHAVAARAGEACASGNAAEPGVGAIGMCFTGNFALSMMLEPAMLAPVLSQPSLPLNDPAGIEIAPDELKQVRERLEREDLTVLAYRFKGDKFCTAQRFAAYTEALGDRFVGRVLPDSAANTDVPPFFARHVTSPHSVVTVHLIDEAGQPTIAARDEILRSSRSGLYRNVARVSD